MKLLFIENRYKTYLFEAIANELRKSGHEIHWLIQNKQFLPSGDFHIYTIDYPNITKSNFKKDDMVEEVIKIDRQINHFNKKDTSYFYYYNNKIEIYLKQLNPDFVFGESTAFHELLTIQNCKKLRILYLNPSTCRYPVGRFSFYKYDTLDPYFGSQETLSKEEAENVIGQIVNRKTAPDYMKPSPASKSDIFKDKFNKIVAYYRGEKYNTPSPLIKYKIEKNKTNIIKNWDVDAEKEIINDNFFKVLYPLQMQPEANIDVWGRRYRDQTKLVEMIAQNLPKDCLLYVKPNPKSKYELNDKLIDTVANNEKIVPLPHNIKMEDVLPEMDLVITVTGTIAIECILSNKPIVTLVKTINKESKNCIYLDHIDGNLENIIQIIKKGEFAMLNQKEKIDFINKLNTTSYPGIISDPFTDSNCTLPSNINRIVQAFQEILGSKII